ncbi:70-kilodalton heat shock protein [Stylosanthes scabra]|uniref:70-kilodalton heat shock protein n=1 Tax=Stylosanthes scabra TaxID=79078 RepID=A0ABU6QAL4_9FABA|nr:70-kilodalton heat shock protein [Stylosanthes scabra]
MATKCAIGIDLGTTYSCVAVWEEQNSRAEIIHNDQGNRTTPSCVAFTNSQRLVGDAAKNQASTNPTNTVFDAKRLIGRKCSDPVIENDLKLWPFKVVSGAEDKPKIVVNYKGQEKQFTPEEISSMILTKMKDIAGAFLESSVTDAVITVPAYFNDSQRKATRDAGTIAGLNVMRILNEPTAAALAYGLQKRPNCAEKRNVFVFDLGGGTFDVSLLTIKGGRYQVKATAGDTHLGGEDFDNRMVTFLAREFQRKHKEDMSGNSKALRRLRNECEKAKRILSYNSEATIDIDTLFNGFDFSKTITRAKFEKLNDDLFEKCMETVKRCLDDGKVDKNDVHDIVLVGGSSRIPKVQKLLQEFFPGKELCKSINPDEAVAYGAAVQASLLINSSHGRNDSKTLKNLALMDVTPLSLGTSIKGDLMSVLIPRNTPIPAKKNGTYFTDSDDQPTVCVDVYEGERLRASENNMLGMFSFEVPPAPRGFPIYICFEVNEDGILNVTVEEKLTGKKQEIAISNERERLTAEEVAKMIEEAEMLKEEDESYKERVKAKNALDECVYKVKKAIKDGKFFSKVSAFDKQRIMGAIREARDLVNDNGVEQGETYQYEKCLMELQSVTNEIMNKINPDGEESGSDED